MALPLPHPHIEIDVLARAREVIATECAGLEALQAKLGDSFMRVIHTLQGLQGRIVVTGMGKSGHIARKIAATFASTGAPAQFVHPAEASHGDLGMITQADIVIALSNSGETPELADIIAYTQRFDIPLVAITAVETSTLARNADILLLLPQANEACSLGLAPTTSTTMMLALGDALAVTLLEKRGFGHEDFHAFHPGGKLGRALMRVGDLMHRSDLPLASLETPISDIILVMTAGRFGCAGIVDAEGQLAGIVTDGDLRRHLAITPMTAPAKHIMTAGPQTISPDDLAADALRLMTERDRPILVLFVVENNIPTGILHVHDLLHAGVL